MANALSNSHAFDGGVSFQRYQRPLNSSAQDSSSSSYRHNTASASSSAATGRSPTHSPLSSMSFSSSNSMRGGGLPRPYNTAPPDSPSSSTSAGGVSYRKHVHSTRKLYTEPKHTQTELSRSLDREELPYSSDESDSSNSSYDGSESYPRTFKNDQFSSCGGLGLGGGLGGGRGVGAGGGRDDAGKIRTTLEKFHNDFSSVSYGAIDGSVGLSSQTVPIRRESKAHRRSSSVGDTSRVGVGSIDEYFMDGEGMSFRDKFLEQRREADSKKKARDAVIKADLEACDFNLRGWLWKKNPGGLKRMRVWKKRYCCFRKEKIVYFKSSGSSNAIGSIPFSEVKRVHRHATKKPLGCRFTIHTSMGKDKDGRDFEFRAATRDEADRWIENLKRCRHLFSTKDKDLTTQVANRSGLRPSVPPLLKATSSPSISQPTFSTSAPPAAPRSSSAKFPGLSTPPPPPTSKPSNTYAAMSSQTLTLPGIKSEDVSVLESKGFTSQRDKMIEL